MQLDERDMLLVTGATGLVGSHVAETARKRGIRTRALVRSNSPTFLDEWGVEKALGDVTDPKSLAAALNGVTVVVHCAAKVGDWGPIDGYREVNVRGLENLLQTSEASGTLKRFIHISSLGVYEARDHHDTDETTPPNLTAIDGYTRTKAEAEQLLLKHIREHRLPAVALRPGFIYGPRDRTVFPKLLGRLKSGSFAFLGSGDKLMNNTYVGNVVDAVFCAIEHDNAVGQVYNITDGRLVSKKEFMGTIARLAGYPEPTKTVPIGVARALTTVLEGTWKMLGKTEAPILSQARLKMLGLNLDYSCDKARREIGYNPEISFERAMQMTIDWFRQQNML
jgi:nucleoside-diphosphate-sugar epimerase